MLQRLVRTILPGGLAAVVAGAFGVAPALASSLTLHVVPSPFISGSALSGAAAIGSADMWAVGAAGSGSGPFQTLAEHFNGTSWSVVPTPSLNASFSGVAGAAGNDVWAVGDQAAGSSVNTLIEHWDGSSWSVISSPTLPNGSELTAVTAPSSDNVWAVGFASGSSNALVEHWDGTSWSIVSSPAFTGVSVTGISADSSTDVWAVGGLAGGGTTSLHWDGTSWSQIPTAFLRFGGVGAVTALSPANVWAVGTGPGVPTGGFSAHPTAVIEHWDGTSWSVVPSPNPNPQGNNSLGAVAAVSAKDIWAVGLQLLGPSLSIGTATDGRSPPSRLGSASSPAWLPSAGGPSLQWVTARTTAGSSFRTDPAVHPSAQAHRPFRSAEGIRPGFRYRTRRLPALAPRRAAAQYPGARPVLNRAGPAPRDERCRARGSR